METPVTYNFVDKIRTFWTIKFADVFFVFEYLSLDDLEACISIKCPVKGPNYWYRRNVDRKLFGNEVHLRSQL